MDLESPVQFVRVAELRGGMRVAVSGGVAVAGLRRARRLSIYELRLDDGSGRLLKAIFTAVKGRERKHALARIASGEAQIVVGTHALIQEGVVFQRLGLAVADEQHRFGVLQRAELRKKGYDADVLVMTEKLEDVKAATEASMDASPVTSRSEP